MKTSRLLGLLPVLVGLAELPALKAANAPTPQDLPEVMPDASASEWVVDRFAGNSTAGPTFFQGPAREVGGLGRCGACPLPDGRVLTPFRDGIAEVDTNGTLRLVSEAQVLFTTTLQVTANVMAYNPADKHVEVLGFHNCRKDLREDIRRVQELGRKLGKPVVINEVVRRP